MKVIKGILKVIVAAFVIVILIGIFAPDDSTKETSSTVKENSQDSEKRYKFKSNVTESSKTTTESTSDDDDFPEYEFLDLNKRYDEGDKIKFTAKIDTVQKTYVNFMGNSWTIQAYIDNVDLAKWLDKQNLYEGDNISICGIMKEDRRLGEGGKNRAIYIYIDYINGQKL